MENPVQFVQWLRSVAPYIHAFRGKTFVVAFPGELVTAGALPVLAQDLSLLHALGIKVVIVHGSRPQVEEQLALRNVEARFHNGLRITDTAALECAKEAAGELRLDIEAAFSQGLPNTPMAHSEIRIISGNFVTARPIGVIDGVDLEMTGVTRKIAYETIHPILNAGGLVLLSPLGFSPTGETFNLTMEDVAVAAATALRADKLIFISETPMMTNAAGDELRELTSAQADALLKSSELPPDIAFYLEHCVQASRRGVPRVHIVPFNVDGSALLEIFTHDGVGTMVSYENLESLRQATIEDVGGILKLIEPLEADGTLVKRGRELIEREIDYFSVIEHDGVIFGCAALYPFPAENMAEMACLIVNPEVQTQGDGERLLKHMENRARAAGLKKLFVLTTRTAHWFLKRGRELIEREIDYFSVIEHDGVIFGCAALYPFPAENMAEMACLIVNPEVQTQGDGERLLKHMENRARAAGLKKLFVLTTRTAHWFLKRGFAPATIDDLPKDRQHMYNWQRKSLVFMKNL